MLSGDYGAIDSPSEKEKTGAEAPVFSRLTVFPDYFISGSSFFLSLPVMNGLHG